MQFIDIVTHCNEILPKRINPFILCKRLFFHQCTCGYVTVITDIGDDGLDIFYIPPEES